MIAAESAANPHIATPLVIPTSAGGLALETNLLLAPVANHCDLAWRITCRLASRGPDGHSQGLGLACTDLLSPQGLLRGTARSLDLAATNDEDSPVCMQLYGGDPDILAEGALWAIKHGADVIDINMGCPVDKVTKRDGGSKLLCDPDRTVQMAARLVRAVEDATRGRVPVTAKLRLGWDSSCIVAPDLARALEGVGIAMITIHGRTTEQYFRGEVDHAGIRDVVQAVDAIPVIGNGDVKSPNDCMQMMQRTGCAGVMIGRGSFATPWIFRQCWAKQLLAPSPRVRGEGAEQSEAGEGLLPTWLSRALAEPELTEKLFYIRHYFEGMLKYRTEAYARTHIARRISWLGKALPPCKPFKEAVRTAKTPDDVRAAIDAFEAGGLRSGMAQQPSLPTD
ncbi:MAG: tRNA-dihydrouridine synthase [Phycisphaerales bacterium]|nr:tRNA-dihydrouridine synthase [Phycisphaerales bacterium]